MGMKENLIYAQGHLMRALELNEQEEVPDDFLLIMGGIAVYEAHLREAHYRISRFFLEKEDRQFPDAETNELYDINGSISVTLEYIDKILMMRAAVYDLPEGIRVPKMDLEPNRGYRYLDKINDKLRRASEILQKFIEEYE